MSVHMYIYIDGHLRVLMLTAGRRPSSGQRITKLIVVTVIIVFVIGVVDYFAICIIWTVMFTVMVCLLLLLLLLRVLILLLRFVVVTSTIIIVTAIISHCREAHGASALLIGVHVGAFSVVTGR